MMTTTAVNPSASFLLSLLLLVGDVSPVLPLAVGPQPSHAATVAAAIDGAASFSQATSLAAGATCGATSSSPEPWLLSRRRVFSAATTATTPLLFGGCPAVAASVAPPPSSSSDYDAFAGNYDSLDGGPLASALGLDGLRAQLVGRAAGRVLEVGVGTGLNLGFYDEEKVQRLDAIDLSQGMLSQCSQRLVTAAAAASGSGGQSSTAAAALSSSASSPSFYSSLARLQKSGKVHLSMMDVGRLDFADGSFDTVLDTFSLCVFPDPLQALKEMRRVCRKPGTTTTVAAAAASAGAAAAAAGSEREREGGGGAVASGATATPGGRVLLLEHSSVSEEKGGGGLLSAYQDLTAAPIASLGKGCVWNQRLGPLLQEAGLEVLQRRSALGGLLSVIEATPVA